MGQFEAPKQRKKSPVLLILCILAAIGLIVAAVLLLPKHLSPDVPPETEAPTQSPTETPTEPPTEPPTEAPTEPATEAPTEPPTEPLPEPTPEDVEAPTEVTTKAFPAGTIYISENCGYVGYYFGEANSGRYCEAVNSAARALEGKADVYCMICPVATGILLSDEVREGTGYSDEKEAMRWMYERMDPLVKTVPLYGTLRLHDDEYLYFHTDHHWTALGAYYAYREFCAQKGIYPHGLEEFETYVFEDYLGSLYNYSKNNAALKANPDTVTAYIPNGTNTMQTWMPSGSGFAEYTWDIVKDVSSYNRGSYYLTFVAGDQPFNYAHNEQITDGSSVLVVKDSYGNAFLPFLIDHYEHIYWIDYRSSIDWCKWSGRAPTLTALVEEFGIRDVILCNNITSTGSSSLIGKMEQIFR